ncbi:MerR family transcriptional regulator [Sphingomonas sp. ID0503]|uniref:MerR family transcriptional regulator n=1 Tax=Sphingomonas sp. ID0503 TaxID=3399691 RepID=UPI003AFB46DF
MSGKSEKAFLTISEVSTQLDVPQHILRYWETKFPQLKPLQRAGNRRYYRPEDVALARRIKGLLSESGYTVRGVQQLLGQKGGGEEPVVTTTSPSAELKAIRTLLSDALTH